MTYIIWLNDFAMLLENYFIDYFILIFLMIKMLQYKMYPAGELRCPTTALVLLEVTPMLPAKFQVDLPFNSGEEAKNGFSRWPP